MGDHIPPGADLYKGDVPLRQDLAKGPDRTRRDVPWLALAVRAVAAPVQVPRCALHCEHSRCVLLIDKLADSAEGWFRLSGQRFVADDLVAIGVALRVTLRQVRRR